MTKAQFTINQALANIRQFSRTDFEDFKTRVNYFCSLNTVKAICDKLGLTSKKETLKQYALRNNLEMTAKATKHSLITLLFNNLK